MKVNFINFRTIQIVSSLKIKIIKIKDISHCSYMGHLGSLKIKNDGICLSSSSIIADKNNKLDFEIQNGWSSFSMAKH